MSLITELIYGSGVGVGWGGAGMCRSSRAAYYPSTYGDLKEGTS